MIDHVSSLVHVNEVYGHGVHSPHPYVRVLLAHDVPELTELDVNLIK